MKTTMPPLFWYTCYGLVLILLGYGTLTILPSDQQLEAPLPAETQKSAGPQDPVELRPQDTLTNTVYLPLIYVPPPPNPKKGVGVVRPPACRDLRELHAAWYFRWNPWPDSSCTPEELSKFVPRLRDAEDMQYLAQAINNAQGSGWLIGFSEPDLERQGNISPAQAAIYWREIEQAADAAGIKLVSPSPSQHGSSWLWQMVTEYQKRYGHKPRFDALGWNIYTDSVSSAKSYLSARRQEALNRNYTGPIWVLEFAGACWQSGDTGNHAIMTSLVPWLNAQSWIGRYAWFPNRITNPAWTSCRLINPSTHQLTWLGLKYRTY